MDRETSLDCFHIQQRALEQAKQLIESESRQLSIQCRHTIKVEQVFQSIGVDAARGVLDPSSKGDGQGDYVST
jgi:hypothetical protein